MSLCNGEGVGPAVYQTFSTNHLSYIKTLVPIYTDLGLAVFREALIVAPIFLDICLDIFGAWINQTEKLFETFFRK